MKKTFNMALWVALPLLAITVSCSNSNSSETPTSKVTASDVKQKTQEAVDTAANYSQQKKDEYIQKMQRKLNAVQEDIQQLKDKAQSGAATITANGKAQFESDLQKLRDDRAAAAQKLDQLKSASGEAWQNLKTGMDQAMSQLGKALDQASSHFKN